MNRRQWIAGATAASASLALGRVALPDDRPTLPEPTPSALPRWRGFNLLSMFTRDNREPFPEPDFATIADFGFDFARLPMDYRCWADPADGSKVDESALAPVDEALAHAEKHGVHVMLNFHRAPGYTVNRPVEPKSVWSDAEALDACAAHWAAFARRYQGIPNARLSFNLFNEPDDKVRADDHRRVVAHIAEAIRRHDPKRLIVCDGRAWARTPPEELVGLDVAAATRGYEPMPISHWHASWVGGSDRWPEPTWPLGEGKDRFDREAMRRGFIAPWKALQSRGVGVMVGEFGAFNRTPHRVVLAWMRDWLGLWKDAGWGWALWNLRGPFGILDSGRKDVEYESWHGHQLDLAMLELLRAS